MTDLILKKGEIEFKLSCRLDLNFGHRYLFKLMQRQKGKKKWIEIKGYENSYRVNTEMDDILKYVIKAK